MFSKANHDLWVEKYRPTSLAEYVFHDDSHKRSFEQFIADKTIPHLLLSGVQGSGKTTIANILIDSLQLDPMDIKVINASDENSVDVMRDKIKNFASTYPMGDFKIIHLEEADYITPNGQAVLRRLMEEFSDQARFILTCNYENKIIPAVRSRCQHFRFAASDKNSITEYAATVLFGEHVKFELDTLDKYVSSGYPDIRKIINMLQQNTSNNKLNDEANTSEAGDYKFALLGLLDNDDFTAARMLVCANVLTEEWESLYRFLYENINKCPKFKDGPAWDAAILAIADHLHKHAFSADPEINAAALFITLANIK